MRAHMLLGKVIVLIVLLLVAYQFYRGFKHSVRNFEREGEALARVSEDFVRALFGCMGHLAKSDGRVAEDEIRAARLIMHRLGLSPAQVRRAIHWFDDGKRPGFPLVQTVREVRRVSARSVAKRTLFLRLLLEVVHDRLIGPRLTRFAATQKEVSTQCQRPEVANSQVGGVDIVVRLEVEDHLWPHHEVSVLLEDHGMGMRPPSQGAPEIEVESKPPPLTQRPPSDALRLV